MVAILKPYVALSILAQSALTHCHLSKRNDSETYAANMLRESMDWMDMYYDNERAYLYSLDAQALTHDTRSSVWYAAGLLARNEGDDAEQAARVVRNVIGGQFTNQSLQW